MSVILVAVQIVSLHALRLSFVSQAASCCIAGAEPPGASSCHTSHPKISQVGQKSLTKAVGLPLAFQISRKLETGRWAATAGTQ